MSSKDEKRLDADQTLSSIVPLGQTRQGNSYFVVLQFKAINDELQTVLIPRADCVMPTVLTRWLANAGAPLDPDSIRDLCQRIGSGSVPEVVVAHQNGWHGNAYLYANEFIGKPDKPYLVLPEIPEVYGTGISRNGSLRSLSRRWSRLARYSPLAASAIGLGLASLIAGPLGVAPRLIHFHGTSTEGKTALLCLGRSVAGNPARNFVPDWNTTGAGFEELSEECRDHLLVIDEATYKSGTASDEQTLRSAAYSFNAQRTKRRSHRYERLQPTTSPGSGKMGASSGELSQSETSKNAGKERPRGAELRSIDVPADFGYGLGIFRDLPSEYLNNKDGARDFAQEVEAAAKEHYGRLGGAFLEHLIYGNRHWQTDARRRMNDFCQIAHVGGDAYERRFAEPFCLIYAALREAQEANLLDWSPDSIVEAVRTVYDLARNSIKSPAQLCESAIAALRERLRHGEVVPADRRQKVEAGVYEQADVLLRNDRGVGEIFVIKPRLIKALCVEHDVSSRDLANALGKLKAIIRGSKAVPTRQVSIDSDGVDERARYWCIRSSFAR